MALSGALTIALALLAGAGNERLLLCRPRIVGDPALARAEAIPEAARGLGGRFLDYGVACEDAGEGARAARRAGFPHAVTATAEGRAEGTRFVLVLTEARTESERSRRALEVAPGQDAVRPLRSALAQLAAELPPEPGTRERSHLAAWSVAGAGVAALTAGLVLAVGAGEAADRADAAPEPAAYTRARSEWKVKRGWSAASLGVGGALLAAGLTWRLAF